MNGRPPSAARCLFALALVALAASGCASWRVPRIDPSGQRIFLPPEAAVAPAATIVPGVPAVQEGLRLTPSEIIAPVGSEVILLASVAEPSGALCYSSQRVEWLLAQDGVGQFVTLGDRDAWNLLRLPRDTPRKVTNHFAVGATSPSTFTITRGTLDASDDVTVQEGQAWISVTSPLEGVSRVTAYAPAVPNWELRKSTGTIHWVDAQWIFPPPAINPVGSRHVFTTTVSRHTNSTPLAGWIVRYEIIGGPPAGFAPDGVEVVEVPTDAAGQASVEILQKQPQAGTSRIGISIIRPRQPQSGFDRPLILGTGTVTKTWTSPDIALRVAGPAQASVGSTVTYALQITNPGDLPSRGVVATAEVPPGLTFLSSNPPAQPGARQLSWNLGDLGPRETRVVEVHLRAEQPGSVNFCGSVRTSDSLTASDCAATTVAVPQLEVRVSGPPTATVGETVRYEVTVTNLGQVAATGLVIKDTFDPGFEHIAARSPIERDLEDLEPGQSRAIFITFRVVQPGELCHTVEVVGQGGLAASARACLTAVEAAAPPVQPPAAQPSQPTQPQGQAAIAVTKHGPQQKQVGEIAEFAIEVRNTGTAPLTNLRIVDSYELALDAVQASQGFKRVREDLVWEVAELAPGQSLPLRINCQCVAPAARACNRVTVYSDQRPPVADEACLTIVPQPVSPSDRPAQPAARPLLGMTIADLNDPLQVGQEATYRVVLTNQGQAALREVVLSVTLPPELTPLPAGTSGPVRADFAGQTIRFQPVAELRPETELRPADSLVFTVRARATQPGTARVLAEAVAQGLPQPARVEEQSQVLP